MSGLLSTIITIMRLQKSLFWGYSAVALLALLLSDGVVANYGVTGAAWLYTALMCGMSLILVVIFLMGLLFGREKNLF